jgi:hypothetical protein
MKRTGVADMKLYRHYKGNEYILLFEGKHSETLEDMVCYKNIKTNEIWVRHASMFYGKIEDDIPRFQYIEDITYLEADAIIQQHIDEIMNQTMFSIKNQLTETGHKDIAEFIQELDDQGKKELVNHVHKNNDAFVFRGLEHDIDFFKNSLALLYSVLEYLKKEIL